MLPDIQQYVQAEVKRQLEMRDRLNAGGMLFDEGSGKHTQGKNLVGLTGDRAIHNSIRTNKTEQTIDTGVITYTSDDIAIFTESAAATDDLTTIEPLTLAKDGDLLLIRAADDGDTVVVRTTAGGVGNIVCTDSFEMDSKDDRMLLQWDGVNEYWVEVSRYDSTDAPWTDFTPSLYQNDSTTALSGTVSFARYHKEGTVVIAEYNTAGNLGNPSGNQIFVDLPVASTNNATYHRVIGSGYVASGGVADLGYAAINPNKTTKAAIVHRGAPAWAASNNGFNMTIVYEAA